MQSQPLAASVFRAMCTVEGLTLAIKRDAPNAGKPAAAVTFLGHDRRYGLQHYFLETGEQSA